MLPERGRGAGTIAPATAALRGIANAVEELVEITLGHPIVLDHFAGTSVLHTEQALAFGTLGYVARASGIDIDARRDFPFVDLGDSFQVPVESGGDVLARYLIRAREVAISTTVCIEPMERLTGEHGHGETVETVSAGSGSSFVEAWRGVEPWCIG